MNGEHWKGLFRDQGWIEDGRLAPAWSSSEEIVVVLRSSEERSFFLKDLTHAGEDLLVFQGIYEDEPYKVWFGWGDILSIWDYRDPLKVAFG